LKWSTKHEVLRSRKGAQNSHSRDSKDGKTASDGDSRPWSPVPRHIDDQTSPNLGMAADDTISAFLNDALLSQPPNGFVSEETPASEVMDATDLAWNADLEALTAVDNPSPELLKQSTSDVGWRGVANTLAAHLDPLPPLDEGPFSHFFDQYPATSPNDEGRNTTAVTNVSKPWNLFNIQQSSSIHSDREPVLPAPSQALTDVPSALVEYYFKETAALFSCYDSQMNPFRTTVAKLWSLSLPMIRTVQSMAAACLTNELPRFKNVGRQLRAAALAMVEKDPGMDPKILLVTLMLGQTSSWFDPQDLGVPIFNLFRDRVKRLALGADNPMTPPKNLMFFQEALVYWGMLLSFVADNVHFDLDGAGTLGGSRDGFRVPHPWTGICKETQYVIYEVGCLVRQERMRMYSRKFSTQQLIKELTEALSLARRLERKLLELQHSLLAGIVNPGDKETPIWHLATIAEVYRRIGLINLYRVFPDLLSTRVEYEAFCKSNTLEVILDNKDPAPDYLTWLASSNGVENRATDSTNASGWLTWFVLETLELLESIPPTSRTRCLQPFMLVVCASELWLPSTRTSLSSAKDATGSLYRHTSANALLWSLVEDDPLAQADALSPFELRVLQARRFVRGRLELFRHVLPPQPVQTCLELVKKTWAKLDDGNPDVYWIDVMMEYGLHTTMG